MFFVVKKALVPFVFFVVKKALEPFVFFVVKKRKQFIFELAKILDLT